ncbi:hypothetical protein ACU8KH_00829 [Lachancea thermotolerans]
MTILDITSTYACTWENMEAQNQELAFYFALSTKFVGGKVAMIGKH